MPKLLIFDVIVLGDVLVLEVNFVKELVFIDFFISARELLHADHHALDIVDTRLR